LATEPFESDALAVIVTEAPAVKVALATGLVMDTTGGLLPLLTVILIAVDVVEIP
jgi:hypothetical protein